MGKQSSIDPMRQSARLRNTKRQRLVQLCVLLLPWFVAPSASAQTQATAVPLLLPSALVFDPQGNLYFAETGNHVIGKFTVGGSLTTVAGNGTQGFAGDNAPAIAAELDSPSGLTIDAAGNLYIADTHNHRVREVTAATGTITTIAGTGTAGFSGDGGPASAAQLNLPSALAIDAAGNIYVADTNNHRIRRIAAGTGNITTVAGNGLQAYAGDSGAATAAAIDSPNGLAVDAAGNLYIADTHNGRVRKVSASSNIITTVAGAGVIAGNVQAYGGDGSAATAAGLALPRGLTVDAAGNLYVADSENHRVRKISASGTITTVAGQGTQTFAGDGAPAVAASLDTPRGLAVSPAGLLTLTDGNNQRVRQLDALPAPGPDIHTIAGLGLVSSAETLSLTGPSVTTYGGGSLTASLSTGSATGSVTFFDIDSGTLLPLATVSLTAGTAAFSTAALAAGSHSITATYAGDASHGPAQSSALALTVTPLSVPATPSAASILYGQPIPTLSGTLTGVLPQDAGKVTAVFATTAAALSPAGTYPISVTLTGSAAVNYTAVSSPVSLTIAQTPTQTSLSASTNSPALGASVTLTTQAASTTSGVPTGSVTLLDGTTILASVPLVSGSAPFSTSSLAAGTHSLIAMYSGDSNFLPSTSATASIVVAPTSSFTLTATGATSQSVPAGSAATFSFSVATQGAAFSSPITLAVHGTPLGAIASFNPSYLPPGSSTTSFTLTIQTPVAHLDAPRRPNHPGDPAPGAALILAALLPVFGISRRAIRTRHSLSLICAVAVMGALLVTLLVGCGDRINTAPESVGAASYTLTVTGTATSSSGSAVQQSANVTLQVLE